MIKKINIDYKLLLWFIVAIGISYILVYYFSPEDFFKSPMYMLLPIVGFFGTYYTTKYFINYLKIKNKYVYLIFFLLIGIISYYLAIFFYYWNIINLNNLPFSELLRFIFIRNEGLFLKSAFFQFLVACGFGILASKLK